MIKFLVMDVDGTLTDGKIYMGSSGEVMKAFNIKDGCGIHDILIPAGITPVIITGRESQIVLNRCKELGITEVYQGVRNKIKKLKEVVASAGEELNTVAYIGDDINDLSCINLINDVGGFTGCPADAVVDVSMVCDFVSEKNGGEGAVREFIEWIVNANNDEVERDS